MAAYIRRMPIAHCIALVCLVAPLSATEQEGSPTPPPNADTNWPAAEPLFIGESLEGWTIYGGPASYQLVGGELRGSGDAARNAFLVSPSDWSDFLLEVEVLIEKGNSGVQIRSRAEPGPDGSPLKGRVVGAQIEIEMTNRRWSGGLYDEGRAGWLDDLSESEPARAAFHPGEWNQYRIECRGDRARTWVNGVPCADYAPLADKRGRIAFQVHSGGTVIRWRNARIAAAPTVPAITSGANQPMDAAAILTAIAALPTEAATRSTVSGLESAILSADVAGLTAAQDQFATIYSDAAQGEARRILALEAIARIPAPARNDHTRELTFQSVELSCLPGQMRWNRSTFRCAPGTPLRFTMENPDSLQHNLMLCAPGSLSEIGVKGDLMNQSADGKAREYIPSSPKVLAAMGLIDPGTSGTMWCFAPTKAATYPLVCAYPGHWRTMNGKLQVIENPSG